MIDDRALTSAVSYALIVAITVTLIVGLLIGTENLIEQNRQQTATEQLDVVEQRLATTIETTHRLARSEPQPGTLSVTRQFPARLAGSQYRITIVDNPGGSDVLRLELVDFDITTTTELNLPFSPGLAETTINGGSVEIVYDASSSQLEVRNA